MIRRVVVLSLIFCLMLAALPVRAQDDPDPASLKALDYLRTQQSEDGGFTNGLAQGSDLSTTADAIVAVAAARQDPRDFSPAEGVNPLTYLDAQVQAGNVSGAGQIAKVLNALAAAGEDPTDFGEHNLVDDLLATQDESGRFGTGAFDHCLALIAMENDGDELPSAVIVALRGMQGDEGGWGFMPSEKADTNTTALCLQALAPTEEADTIAAGLDYLKSIQNKDGGWPYQSPSDYGTDSDANSTALVILALVANGEDLSQWNNPQDYLRSLQLEDGSFTFQEANPAPSVLATIGAIPALEGVALNSWAPVPAAE